MRLPWKACTLFSSNLTNLTNLTIENIYYKENGLFGVVRFTILEEREFTNLTNMDQRE